MSYKDVCVKDYFRKKSYIMEPKDRQEFDNFISASSPTINRDTPNKISIIKNGKYHSQKTGRFLKELFVTASDTMIQNLGDDFNCIFFEGLDHIKILEGEDIRGFYKNGPSSCMSDCPEFLDLFVDNPEVVKLLTVDFQTSSIRHAARGLLWNVSGDTFLDCIYSTSSLGVHILERWAQENSIEVSNWYTRHFSVNVKLRDGFNGSFPYMDSFQYLEICSSKEGILSTDKSISCQYELTTTDGFLNLEYCVHCGEGLHVDKVVYFNQEPWCVYCHVENFTDCDKCGGIHHNDTLTHINEVLVCETCFQDRYTLCPDCEKYWLNEDMKDGLCPKCAKECAKEVILEEQENPSS